MAGLAREVEDDIDITHERLDREPVADVRDGQLDVVADIRDVEEVASIRGDEAVHQDHCGAFAHESTREGGADEADAPCDENPGSREAHVSSCCPTDLSFLEGS